MSPASAFSAHERTVPVRVTVVPSARTVMVPASTWALRTSACRIRSSVSAADGRGGERDVVGHGRHPPEVPDGALGRPAFVLPVDLAGQDHLVPAHLGPDGFRYLRVPHQRTEHLPGDVGLGDRPRERRVHPDVVDERHHPAHALGRPDSGHPLGVAGDLAGERHRPAAGGDTDPVGVDVRCPLELGLHRVLQVVVGAGGCGGGHARAPVGGAGRARRACRSSVARGVGPWSSVPGSLVLHRDEPRRSRCSSRTHRGRCARRWRVIRSGTGRP